MFVGSPTRARHGVGECRLLAPALGDLGLRWAAHRAGRSVYQGVRGLRTMGVQARTPPAKRAGNRTLAGGPRQGVARAAAPGARGPIPAMPSGSARFSGCGRHFLDRPRRRRRAGGRAFLDALKILGSAIPGAVMRASAVPVDVRDRVVAKGPYGGADHPPAESPPRRRP